MAQRQLKAGTIVIIYEDPFTKKVPEGKAEIVRIEEVYPRSSIEFEYKAIVKFLDQPEERYYRSIVRMEAPNG